MGRGSFGGCFWGFSAWVVLSLIRVGFDGGFWEGLCTKGALGNRSVRGIFGWVLLRFGEGFPSSGYWVSRVWFLGALFFSIFWGMGCVIVKGDEGCNVLVVFFR